VKSAGQLDMFQSLILPCTPWFQSIDYLSVWR